MQDTQQPHEATGVFGSQWKTLAKKTRTGMSILTVIRSTVGLIYDQVLSFWLNVKTCVEAHCQIPVGLFI